MTAGYRLGLTVLLQLMTVVDDVKAYRRIEVAFGSVDQCHTPSANCFGEALLDYWDLEICGPVLEGFILHSSCRVLVSLRISKLPTSWVSSPVSAAFQVDVGEVVDGCTCLNLSEPSSPYTSLEFCILLHCLSFSVPLVWPKAEYLCAKGVSGGLA